MCIYIYIYTYIIILDRLAEFSCPYNFIGSLPESSTRGLLVGKLLVGGLGVGVGIIVVIVMFMFIVIAILIL